MTDEIVAETTEEAPSTEELAETGSDTDAPWTDPTVAEQMIKDLRKEAATYRTRAKELEPFAEEADRLKEQSKTDLQRVQERAESAENEKVSLSTENARLRVALEKGVPLDVIESLGGETVEEISTRLEALVAWKEADKVSKPTKPVSQLRSAGTGDDDDSLDLTDPTKMRAYLAKNA